MEERERFEWLANLRRDLRVSIRMLFRHRTFTVTTIVALSLAIAVNTTMFSIIDAMLNPAAGARDPDQLYGLRYWGTIGKQTDATWRARIVGDSGKTYQSVTGSSGTGFAYQTVERGRIIRQVSPVVIRPNFFAVLGVGPIEGTLAPPGDHVAASAIAIISNRLREQLFRTGEPALGQSITLDGRSLKVTGVVRRFAGMSGLDGDVWTFQTPGRDVASNTIRLKPGATLAEAEREFGILAAQLAQAEGEPTKDTRFELKPLKQQFEIKQFHWALIGSAIAILLVACTNLANLQLARGLSRAGELAMRSAVGASRKQIVTQLMIETGVLAAIAMVVAIALSLAASAAIRATIPPGIGDYVIEPETSGRTVLFAGITAMISLMLVGFAPALRVSRIDLNSLLKGRAGTGAHRANRRAYGALVITQIAFTLPLVCAAVLLSRSLLRMTSKHYLMAESVGYDTRPLINMSLMFPPSHDSARSMASLANTVVARARGVTGVANAAVEFWRSARGSAVTVDDEDGSLREVTANMFSYHIVTPGYFRTFGLPMERGTDFAEGTPDESSVIMNRGSAWYLWPRKSSKGRLIKLGARRTDAPWLKLQGIVGDRLSEEARERQRALDTLRMTEIYRVITSRDSIPASKYWTWIFVTMRASGDPQQVASALRRAFSDVSTRPPRVQLWEEAEGIPQRIAVLTFISSLFTTFGLLALGLAGLGVYGIVAQSVSDRRREVAVRIALGATARKVVYVLLREGNVLVLAGVAIGLFMSKQTMGWLEAFIGELDLTNALLFGLLCIGLFCAMVGAAMIPAIRATRLEPMDVLRSE